MGKGRGKGGDQTGAIAAGCCGIYCMVCFFLVGIPCLILGIIFVRIAEGDYDDRIEDAYADCVQENREECFGSTRFDCDTEEGCLSLEDWEDVKGTFNTIGIVLIIFSLLSLIAAIVLIILMFTSLCKRSNQGGMIHTHSGAAVVTSYPMQQGGYPQQTGAYPQQQTGAYPQQQQGGYAPYPQAQAPYPTGDFQKPPEYAPPYGDTNGEKNPAFGMA